MTAVRIWDVRAGCPWLSRAEQDGRLQPGDTVVEYTGGSTGTSLALICAARRCRIHIVTSDAFGQEKRDHITALGAELALMPDNIASYYALGEEIWHQTGGRLEGFVHCGVRPLVTWCRDAVEATQSWIFESRRSTCLLQPKTPRP